MPAPSTRAYQPYRSLRLLSRANTASLPEREGLFREVVQLNLGLANAIVRHYFRSSQPAARLRQAAIAGLDKAARTFDAQREQSFCRHATWAIAEEIRRRVYPRRVFRRAPPELDGLALRILTVLPELADELGHSPRARDIAVRLDADVDDVIEVLATDGRPANVQNRLFGGVVRVTTRVSSPMHRRDSPTYERAQSRKAGKANGAGYQRLPPRTPGTHRTSADSGALP